MSLGSWFRDYVYIPLGGNRVKPARWVFNVLVVWLLTGLWHGAAWNFVLWGLLYALFLLIEKWVPAIQKLPAFLRHIYVLLVVMLGFVLFNAADLKQALSDIGGLFGFGGLPLVSTQTLYYLRSYLFLLTFGIIGTTPRPREIFNTVAQKKWGIWVELALMAASLVLCTAYLVDGSFNPFLYFRF